MIRSFQYSNPGFEKNWGDIISSPIIASFLKIKGLDKDLVTVHQNYNQSEQKLVSIGSVSQFIGEKDVVWGTGCITQNAIFNKPHKILAVRGPLTRNEFKLKGIECPDIYGDPALLFPLIWNKTKTKTHKVGIIPHYVDIDNPIIKQLEERGFKIIDICSGITEFLEDLLSVEMVLSSSLHGLIAADAYGIPNSRIIFSDKVFGGHFKFIDYCLSVDRKIDYGYVVENSNIDFNKLTINDKISFDSSRILEVAPWNDEKIIKYLDV